ncbi:SMI1/KNR4 family protein [Hymenobacter negativus]|uniref:SMI1/KNR4 family protein n=1 Tax=Hymenobacter negativus TaxID=2795026 RepID=A0ABS3QIM8_9BACT|nr:SMI1/KNR4 family protein [Hymenobacter negativus]MBO2011098.1 SMI1/KNR4 family protein [Hymenobacter negativus]
MVNNALTRIAHWLAAHAPRILHESLNPSASEAQLEALEAALGHHLPPDYKALYRRHDGLNEDADNFGSFFYGISFLPLAAVTAIWQHRTAATAPEPLRRAHPAIKADNAQRPQWLCLGFDGSHVWLCVDLDPVEGHRYGQVILVDEELETAFPVADSVVALLTEFAHDLEHGHYFLDPDALADGNEYLSPDAEIDLINWPSTKRWATFG